MASRAWFESSRHRGSLGGIGFTLMARSKNRSLTPRWSQRRLPLEFMDDLSYTTIIELAEPLARRRGSALDR